MTDTQSTLATAVAEMNSREDSRRAETTRLEDEARQAAAKAAEADEAARVIASSRGVAGSPIMPILRELSMQVNDARQAAINAVRTGDEPALEAWLRYRRIGAEVKGRWSVVAGSYTAATGLNAPDGPRTPPLVTHSGRMGDGVLPAEDFAVFLVHALAKAEVEIGANGADAAAREIDGTQTT